MKWSVNLSGRRAAYPFSKTANARGSLPLPKRVDAILDMRRTVSPSEWVFPAPTKSWHLEPTSLKKRHRKAYSLARLEHITIYTFRPI